MILDFECSAQVEHYNYFRPVLLKHHKRRFALLWLGLLWLALRCLSSSSSSIHLACAFSSSIQSNAIQRNPMQSNPVQFSPIQSNPIQSDSIQFNSLHSDSLEFGLGLFGRSHAHKHSSGSRVRVGKPNDAFGLMDALAARNLSDKSSPFRARPALSRPARGLSTPEERAI